MLEQLFGNYVCIELYGEGYYSGQSETHVAFVTKSFYDEHEDLIVNYTPYFHELDGKHSEVEGETFVIEIVDYETACRALKHLATRDSDYQIWDGMFDSLDKDLVKEQIDLSDSIFKKLQVKTVITFDDAVI